MYRLTIIALLFGSSPAFANDKPTSLQEQGSLNPGTPVCRQVAKTSLRQVVPVPRIDTTSWPPRAADAPNNLNERECHTETEWSDVKARDRQKRDQDANH